VGEPVLELMGEHPGAMRVGRFQNLVIVAWSGQSTGEAVRTLQDLMVPLHRGSSELRSYIHMLPHHVPMPDAEARTGMRWMLDHYAPHIACAAVLLEGSGFWASAMRNVVIGVRMLTTNSFAFRIDTTHDELLAWLPDEHHKRTGVRLPPSELRSLLEQAGRWQQPAARATTGAA
jgi:hypothetical protein